MITTTTRPERSSSDRVTTPEKSLGSRIFRNTLTLIGGQGLNLIVSAAATVLLARYLGSERLGEFGAIYAYLTLYGWLATFGLDPILAREVSKSREHGGSILLTGVCISSCFALAAICSALLFAPYLGYGGHLRFLLWFAAIDILLLSPLRLPGIIFQVDLRQWYGVGIGLIRQSVWLAVLAFLAFLKVSLFWIIAGRSLCAVLEVTLILLATYHRGFLNRPWKFRSEDVKKYLSYGFPIAISTLAIGVYHRIDQVMLHKMAGDEILGGYGAAVRLTEFLSVLPVALMGSLFPILSQLAKDDDRFQHYLKLSFRALMAVVFGACALISPLAGWIVHLLYGAKYVAAGPLLGVLIWSEVPEFFGVVISNGLVAKNLQNYLPLSTAVGAIANVVLNLFLIPHWGALGASWASNISYSLAAIFLFLVFRPTRPLAWLGFRISLAPCLLALLIAGTFFVLPLQVVFEAPIIVAAYGLGAWLTGTIQRSEIDHMWHLIGGNFAFSRTRAI